MKHSSGVHREMSDVNVSALVVFVVVFVVTTAVVFGGVFAVYRYFGTQAARSVTAEYPLATKAMRRLPPEPRLQTDPRDDLANLRRSEDDVLQSYGWIDRGAGIVRIPVEQAMKLTAARGLPTR
jgi:hypothetical protein